MLPPLATARTAMSRSVIVPTGMPCSSTTGIIPQSLSAIIRATCCRLVSRPQQAGLAVITVFSSMVGSWGWGRPPMLDKARFRAREPRPPPPAPAFRHGQPGVRAARLVVHVPKPRMTMRHPLALALATLLAAAPFHAQAQDASPVSVPAPGATAPQAQDNPFFHESPLPLHYPQFDKIQDSDFAPAFDRGMADELAEIDAIANNPEPPTFENTVVALQKTG